MSTLENTFAHHLAATPVVAILRGLQPADAGAVGRALIDAGIRLIEVPLNRPHAHKALATLIDAVGSDAMVGAGTVLDVGEVNVVNDLGGRFIVSPDTNESVIAETKHRGLISLPGFFTASEAFRAIRAGADALKLFPGDIAGAAGVKALKAVLPDDVPLLVVGGVSAANAATFKTAGASGYGIGSALFKPGWTAGQVSEAATAFVAAIRG
ncbi:2-dehydro-3-deoxy-6-phosphogalactonate aldolase [Breoghania sp. L-A4]|uniref:2-dehydro-3-deoxy-6-phosphogalactonate aldolase n=1 Tax=Breoghania sp. L-A4 TaxID=2304600 RepID=UPI000E35BEB5|nr:2-dehydro-3-deoxy-6-phosphogalactonate aldolase [Breoghania sp. L-A4]AXS39725.1 2-dehydro-3-deoxy-6-phosphogalactonate aldolase [Breoghania sp. L-A4]